jgi:hypothetical protein
MPPVVPVVVHHSEGGGGWSEAVAFEELLDVEGEILEALRPHLPLFSFVIDDLSVTRDDELRARAMSALGRVALFCLKRSRSSDDMGRELGRWRDLLAEVLRAPNGVAALAAVLSYLLETSQTPRERLRTLTRTLGPRAEEAFMTGAQILREEGRQQGRSEGKAQAVLAVLEARGLRVSDEQRARVLGCTDLDELERWVRKAVTVKTAGALFAAPKLRRKTGA